MLSTEYKVRAGFEISEATKLIPNTKDTVNT